MSAMMAILLCVSPYVFGAVYMLIRRNEGVERFKPSESELDCHRFNRVLFG